MDDAILHFLVNADRVCIVKNSDQGWNKFKFIFINNDRRRFGN